GSHTCVELLTQGYQLTVIDNLSNSCELSLQRVQQISGKSLTFIQADVRDFSTLVTLLQHYQFDAVIHFAGLKAVGESVAQPLRYFDHNIAGTLSLLRAMQTVNLKTLVFSSSATVYGDPQTVPIRETAALSATNPYGRSKLIIEQMLADLSISDSQWKIARLRYFNPVGAHPSGLIGEDPKGIPNNLMPFISQVACGRRQYLSIFGNDYPTIDGTGVRDYIHVVDLALGHLAALEYLFAQSAPLLTVNLGNGCGVSVLEMVKAFELASGQKIPYRIVGRRAGDIASCYANVDLAQQLLNWQARYDLKKMCADSWHWQSLNPNGYE
ncbi:MAG: hypothetical protein RL637_1791, partial [Pseudomonadota bacterium]